MERVFRKTDFIRRAAILLLLLVTSATAWATDPFGYVNVCTGHHGSIYLELWALDEDDLSARTTIHVYLRQNGQNKYVYNLGATDLYREDAINPHYAGDHAMHRYINVPVAGTYDVYVYVINAAGDGTNPLCEHAWKGAPYPNYASVTTSSPYTVTYNANGGSGAPSATTKSHGINLTLSSTQPTRSGYHFAGWNTAADGSGTSYNSGATYTANADLTLYAQWAQSGDYSVEMASGTQDASHWSFSSGAANFGNTITVNYSGSLLLESVTLRRKTTNTYELNSSNISTAVSNFNSQSGSRLVFTANISEQQTFTCTEGEIDMNGHSFSAGFYIRNNEFGKTITIKNGTVAEIDGAGGFNDYYNGTVVLENMTVSGRVWTDGHPYIINGGTYEEIINDINANTPGIVTIYDGKFSQLGNWDSGGTFTLYGGKYAVNPSSLSYCTIPSGYSVQSNTGSDSGTYPWVVRNTGLPVANPYSHAITEITANRQWTFTMPSYDVEVVANYAASYRAYNTSTHAFETHPVPDNITAVTSGTTTMSNGWYVVNSNVTVSSRITVNGTVHLILADGATLTASQGITVNNGNTLNIYGQTSGTGALNATGAKLGGDGTEAAGIGSTGYSAVGNINIHGGRITATGADWSAGIGGGVHGGGGSITIYGGTTSAAAGEPNYGNHDAIGSGSEGANVTRSLADGLRVATYNNTTPVAYGNRVSNLNEKKVTVEPCTSHNLSNNVCSYCGLTIYAVTYNSNYATSGTVPAPQTSYQSGQTVTILGNTGNLVRTGYTFSGWNTAANGLGTDYTAGTTFAINNSLTLYAKWTPIGNYADSYIAYNDATGEFETRVATNYIEITESTTSLSNGFYVARAGSIGNNNRITVSGTVHLILCDGADLWWAGPTGGVNVENGATLHIYGQSGGTGKLTAGSQNSDPGIGPGNVIVHGGFLDAHGSAAGGAAIGGKNGSLTGGTLTVRGGKVKGSDTGYNHVICCNATITGGTVEVTQFCQAFGGTITLGDMKVYSSADATTPVDASQRESICRNTYVKIVPCTEHNMENYVCTWCGFTICHVSYDSNNATSGTVPTDATDYESGQTVTVLGNTGNLERTGYIFGGWNTQADGLGTNYAPGETFTITSPVTLYATWAAEQLELANNADNGDDIDAATGDGMYYDVTLADRTLYRDGDWNTLCLPFALASFTGTPLEGATVKTLASSDFEGGTLTMTFSDNLTSIEAGKPYIVKYDADLVIRSAADWNTFATNVNNGTESYQGKTVKLAANISVSTMVGTDGREFKGTFDGCGHTLTFSYTTDADNAAPFQWIKNAVIKNLKVTGEIRSSQMFAAGFVARAHGDNAIENSVSSVTIHASKNGDGTHGGFVGRIESDCKTFTFTNCLFNGTFDGSNTDNWCPFAAWSMGNSNTNFTFNNCLCSLAGANVRNGCATFYRNGTPTLNGAYYTQAIGTAQGTYTTATGNELQGLLGEGWEVNNGIVVPKMVNTVSDIVTPVFSGVTISNATANVESTYANFIGSYAPLSTLNSQRLTLYDAHNPDGDAMHAALSITTPTVLLTGYSDFVGWYTDTEKTNPVTSIPFATDGTVTLYAKWTPTTYTITYDLMGGSVATANPASYTIESAAITLNNPTREGYTFAGWTGTDINGTATTVTITSGSTGNREYTATWTPIAYTITYDLAGGTVATDNPTSYTIESGNITLNNPTRTGYTFAGWIGTGLTELTMTVTIPAGSMGNQSYIATWAAEQLALANNADNGDDIDAATGDGMYYDVTLADRTLYRDGDWNTLVLPFSLSNFTGTPLEDATVKTLTSSGFAGGTLTMTFSDDLTSIDAGKPYIVKWKTPDLVIRNTEDWNTFADNVTNSTDTYEGKLVKLAADISVSKMVGADGKEFRGIFDGCGHTLNVTLTGSGYYVAPFSYVNGCTIKNLIVTGTVNGGMHCSGLIGGGGASTNTSLIENCDVRVAVNCNQGNKKTHCGGFIGHSLGGAFTFRNCKFSGSISGATTYTGVFMGWAGQPATHINCLAAGTYSYKGTLAISRGTNTYNNCYTTRSIGSGFTYTTATGEMLRTMLGSGWEVRDGNVVPKMMNTLSDIENPVFKDVTISNTTANVSTTYVDFVGTYDPITYASANRSILFLGGGSTLYYPDGTASTTIGACRGYFQLNGITAGNPSDPQTSVKAFVLNFGDENADGVVEVRGKMEEGRGKMEDAWYDLSGRKLDNSNSKIQNSKLPRGIYIHNGRKVLK